MPQLRVKVTTGRNARTIGGTSNRDMQKRAFKCHGRWLALHHCCGPVLIWSHALHDAQWRGSGPPSWLQTFPIGS
eukprot:1973240-Amphidinium_carterae.1